MSTAPAPEATRPLWGAEYDGLRRRVRAWVQGALAPHVEAWEAAEAFPRDVFAQAGAQGLFRFAGDLVANAVVTQELSACGSGGVAAALGAHKDLFLAHLTQGGTAQQRARWLGRAERGELIGALAVTEPSAGSDVAALRARATALPGGGWLLDGIKTFITNGTWADVLVVAATTDPAAGAHGITLFVVEAADAGVASRRIPTLGWRPSGTGELVFTDVHLPPDRVLGGPGAVGQGFAALMSRFQWERLVMALAAVGQGEDLLRGVRPAGAAARRLLAELAVEVAAARALTEHALRRLVAGDVAVAEVSMAKRMACDLAVTVAEAVLPVCVPAAAPRVERALRDARLGPIGGGTAQVMDELIARTAGL